MMILLRLIHVMCGALVVGGVVLLNAFIMPAIGRAGPAGGQVIQQLTQRTALMKYLPSVGGFAVLSGIALFVLDTKMSNGTFASSPMGMTYSIGGLAAALSLIIGSAMGARSGKEMGSIIAAVAASGGPPTGAQATRIGELQAKMRTGGMISTALILVAIAAMSVARYV